jgi:hypothetical protein
VYKVVVVVGSSNRKTRGGEGFGSKYLKPSRVKQRWGMVCRGGGVMHMRWWWWGRAITK